MEYRHPKGKVFYRKLGRTYPAIVRSEGIYFYDEKGKRYIDGSGGALVTNIGHGHKEVLESLTRQMRQVAYVHGTQFTTKSIEEYAEALTDLLPKGLDKIYFLSGGSESVESAVKFARQYFLGGGETQKWRVIARWHSYHGSTLGALSLTGRIGMRRPFLPLLINFPHLPPPYCYRCPLGLTYPSCDLECARALEKMIQLEGPETISAVILEPVIGATIGAVVPPEGYLALIKTICEKYNVLYIDDEVMAGMGRTGRWFAIEHWKVQPDLMLLGKGMSGGYFPLSAMAVRGEFVERLKEAGGGFVHGHTFSHHPVGCAVGLATLRFIQERKLVEQSANRGSYLLRRLGELKRFSFVGDVRGKGLMTAIEFVRHQETREPFPRSAKFTERVMDLAFGQGLALYPSIGFVDGTKGDGVMIGPPFIIEESQIDELVEILKSTFSKLEAEQPWKN